MKETLFRWIGFDPTKHNMRTEVVAGLTTFLTMSYILAVNPDILGTTGMDKGAVFTATALASALGTILIAFLAKLPFAQAPGMGVNSFFAFVLVSSMGYTWQQSLAAVFVEGIVFILLTIFNVREKIAQGIPFNLRFAISAGVGMFIAFIGLKNAGIIVDNPATLVALGEFTPTSLLAFFGILLSAVLVVRKVKGALFFSILICTIVGIPMGVTQTPDSFRVVSMPHSIESTFLQFDFSQMLSVDMLFTIVALIFMDLFDTLGTLIGAAAKTDLMDKDGNVKNMKNALMADAIATMAGSVLGTSTVTTYVESSSGVAAGGRTGMTALVVSAFFLLALFLSPLFLIVPSAATSGALVLVGVFMLDSIQKIDLSDVSEALPSFITIIGMVLTYNIAEGMSLGLISYALLKLMSGKFKDLNITLCIVATLLILRYVYLAVGA